MFQTTIISFISQLSILALQAHYFYEIHPLALLANLIIVPYFSFTFIPALFTVFLVCFIHPEVSFFLSKILVQWHERFLFLLQKASGLLDVQWVIGEIPPIGVMAYTVFFVMMASFWSEKRSGLAFTSGAAAVLVLMAFSAQPYFSSKGTVTMLDIGQGDAFVIELPYRRGVIMIDAAGPPIYSANKNKTSKQIILPFLKSKGIDRLDALVVSHKDTDHSGSVPYLFKELNVVRMIVSPYFDSEQKYDHMLRVKGGEKFTVSGQTFRVLHPYEDHEEPNDNSLVLDCFIGGKRWLFTGDISTKIEEKILKKDPALTTHVLKVGHHGSDTSTSSSWLDRLKPEVALISAGKDNRYGHPHEEVVHRLDKTGTMILQTDRHGAVQYNFYGQNGTFSTFFPYNASRE